MKKISFERIVSVLFGIFFSMVMLVISYYSFRYTKYLNQKDDISFLEGSEDNIFGNLLFALILIAAIFLISMLNDRLKEKGFCHLPSITLAFSMLFAFSFSLIWVLNGHFFPISDCQQILICLERIMHGDYSDFAKGKYLEIYNQQLGMISILRPLYMIPPVNANTLWNISVEYIRYEILNCICVPVFIFFGDRTIRDLSTDLMEKTHPKTDTMRISFHLLMCSAFVLFFYTPYVYGEVISVTIGIIIFDLSVRVMKHVNVVDTIFLFALSAIGFLARTNFAILLIAIAIVAVVIDISEKRLKRILIFLALPVFTLLISKLNVSYYEHLTGEELNGGMPFNCWIAMGLNEYSPVGYGWYNGQSVQFYVDAGCDREAAKEAANNYIHDRLAMFSNGVGTSPVQYYKEKFFSQWIDPLYNCLVENKVFIPDPPDIIWKIVKEDGLCRSVVLKYLNGYQFLVYFGAFLYEIVILLKKKPFFWQIPAIFVCGGVLFSLLWEAMGRYIFPYYIMMIPMAGVGYGFFVFELKNSFIKWRKNR